MQSEHKTGGEKNKCRDKDERIARAARPKVLSNQFFSLRISFSFVSFLCANFNFFVF